MRADERLGIHTRASRGTFNALASVYDSEAATGRRRDIRDYGEGVCGAAAGTTNEVLRRGGQSGEPEYGPIYAMRLGRLAIFSVGRLREADSKLSARRRGAGSVLIVRFTKRTVRPGVGALDMKGSIHAGAECARLEQEVDEMIAAQETRVIFDMAGVTHIDSAAIGAIVKCFTKLKRAGGALRIASAQPMILYSLKMTKLDTLIAMFPTADEAAAGFDSDNSRSS